MPKSLKRIAEPDVFDFGKAVTTVLSKVKELSKTHNTLVDEVQYLESRKKQETNDLEKLIAEKTEVSNLKTELTQKIIEKKSKFLADVSAKREELAVKEADLIAEKASLAEDSARLMQDVTDRQNEVALRSNELTKEINSRKAELDSREANLVERENAIQATKDNNAADEARLLDQQNELSKLDETLHSHDEARSNKQHELDAREAIIAKKELELEKQRAGLASLATDLQGQATLIEREKNKNKSDAEMIRDLNKNVRDKQNELNAREIHLNDREATALTH